LGNTSFVNPPDRYLHMQPVVIASAHYLQIAGPVIGSVPVNVVNHFGRFQFPAKGFFNQRAVRRRMHIDLILVKAARRIAQLI